MTSSAKGLLEAPAFLSSGYVEGQANSAMKFGSVRAWFPRYDDTGRST
jgi:hypothetical protein